MMIAAKIEDHLDMILPMLLDLMAAGRQDWTTLDIVNLCGSGAWQLFVDREENGFLMVSFIETEFSKTKILKVEICCHGNTCMHIPDFYPFLDMLAVNMGCKKIIMESERKGWERIGWQADTIRYSRPVMEVPNV